MATMFPPVSPDIDPLTGLPRKPEDQGFVPYVPPPHPPIIGGPSPHDAAPPDVALPPLAPPPPPPPKPGLEVAGKDITSGGDIQKTPESEAAGRDANEAAANVKSALDAATAAKQTFVTETRKAEGIVAAHDAKVQDDIVTAEKAAQAARARKQAERDQAIAAKQLEVDKAAGELERSQKSSQRDLWDDMSAPNKIFAALAQGISAGLYGYQGGYKPGSAGVAPATAAFQRLDAADRQKKLTALQNSKDYLALQKSNKAEADAIFEKALDRLDAERLAKISLLQKENTAFAARYKANPELSKLAADSENAGLEQLKEQTKSQIADRTLVQAQRYEKKTPQTVTHLKTPETAGGKLPLAAPAEVKDVAKLKTDTETMSRLAKLAETHPAEFKAANNAKLYWQSVQENEKRSTLGVPSGSIVNRLFGRAKTEGEAIEEAARDAKVDPKIVAEIANLRSQTTSSVARGYGGVVNEGDRASAVEDLGSTTLEPDAFAKSLRERAKSFEEQRQGFYRVRNFNEPGPAAPAPPRSPREIQAKIAELVKQGYSPAQATQLASR